MKILYLITKSELGGAQTHVYQLIKHMKEQGHDVALASYPGGWLEERARELGVSFYANPFFANSYNPFHALRALRTIQRAVNDFSPDIVHCHSSAAGFFGRLVIRGRIPTVFTAHSWAFTDGAPLLRKIVAIIAEKMVSGFTDRIICVSQFDKALALRYRIAPHRKLSVIYNGVEEIRALPEKAEKEKTRILFVGRLAYPKKVSLLIESFGSLPDAVRRNAVLTIVGDGPEKESLCRLIKEKGLESEVALLGAREHREVIRLMQASDMFVLLSKHEGFPMTILEAMAAGLSVIASGVGGIPEQIDDSCGIVVSNERQAVTSALYKLITDAGKRAVMGSAARKRAEENFSLPLFLKKTETVYRELIA